MNGRRRQLPFEGADLPRVLFRLLPSKDAREEVVDEKELAYAEQEGRDARELVHSVHVLEERVLVGIPETALMAAVPNHELPAEHERDEDGRSPEVGLRHGLVH